MSISYQEYLLIKIKPQSLPNALHRDMRGFRGRGIFLVKFKHTQMNKEERVNGYTNIQTYRLCVWLDNSVNYHNKGLFDYFFDLVRDGEFEESDYEVIDWNEVVERYSNEQRSYYLGSITNRFKRS